MQILKVFHHGNCEYYWFKNNDFPNRGIFKLRAEIAKALYSVVILSILCVGQRGSALCVCL